MRVYVGLDVASSKTAVCVIDEAGKVLWESMLKTHPLAIAGGLKQRFQDIVQVGLETGSVEASSAGAEGIVTLSD